jgi:dihydropteroate synthase
MAVLDFGGRPLDLRRPRVMGILNVTPDSFSDGGRFFDASLALDHARAMVAAGADLIDVGGESTRPGAAAVDLDDELSRVIPVIGVLAAELPVPVSVDTSKPEVMRAGVAAGAGLINDVRALRAQGALRAAADLGVPVCLMHMQGEPRSMQAAPVYDDVVADVRGFLARRMDECVRSGVRRDQLIVDPGFGFGKTLAHNLRLLARLRDLETLGAPILVGISRKSMLGTITGRDTPLRLSASIAAALIAVQRGAQIVRVHDVAETVDALEVLEAVRRADMGGSVVEGTDN